MEQNLENVSDEIVKASASASNSAPAAPAKSKGLVLAVVFFALLAVAGIAGAVYFCLDANNKAADNTKLQGQLNLIKTETGAELVETEENGTTTTEVEIISTPAADAKDYIYVGDWGLKIKIPENLTEISYKYVNHKTGYASGYLCLIGVKDNEEQYSPSFLDIDYASLGCVERIAEDGAADLEDTPASSKRAFLSQDGYYWIYSGPQAVYSTIESEQQLEIESVELIREMLKNPDNYSAI